MKKQQKHEESVVSSNEVVKEVLNHFEPSEIDELRVLYQKLKDLGINSIGDLEVKIARLQ